VLAVIHCVLCDPFEKMTGLGVTKNTAKTKCSKVLRNLQNSPDSNGLNL
jgi:hypothetical protein